jgi:type IX secretion system PorP/SprF family membrane protein
MRNVKILVIFGVLFCAGKLHAQDPTFTQFYANPIYLNPAFAGSNGCPRYNVNFRNEWPSLTNNYITSSASYDQYFKNISGGFGVLATNDIQGKGTINTSMLGLVYSYHLKVNRKFAMLFGVRAAWYQKFLDWDKLTFGDMIDPRRGFVLGTNDVPRGGSRGFFDASAGFVGFSKRFFFGVAGHHLNRPNESVIIGNSPMPIRLTAHAGAEIPVGGKSKYNTNTTIMPNIIYQYQQGFQELNLGTYVKYGSFQAGVWYRNRDAFILTVGVNTGKFRVGYSYDVTISPLNAGKSGGSHEISLGIYPVCKPNVRPFKMIVCPSF